MTVSTAHHTPLDEAEELLRQQELEETRRLFRLVAAQDREAFSALHQRFSGLVFSTVLQVLHNPHDAEEVVQEVFAQLWKKAAMYSEERGKPITWLTTLARNRAIDRFRSRDRRQRLYDGYQQEPEIYKGWQAPSPSGEVETGELAARVRSAVMQLSPDQRQVIQMACLEGLTQAEIAERTGAPLGTVKARIRRGLGKLRGMIKV